MFDLRPRYRGYDDLFDQMVQAVPSGTFYDFGRPIVMWSRKPIGFQVTTDNPGYPIRITRERLGDFDLGVDQGTMVDEVTVVPQPGALQTMFAITLGRGRNRLTAREILPSGLTGRKKIIEVVATTNTLIFEAYGREIFKAVDRADQQATALYSRYSTRLLDQLPGVGDLLPDVQTLKILATKLLIRSLIHFPATKLGVRNQIEAVTLNTPIFESQREGSNPQIETNRLMRTVENTAGQEAHVWFPNLAVTRWLAYVRMANTFRNNFTIRNVKDGLVTVDYKGRTNEHQFDFESAGANFLTNLSLNDGFNNIEVLPSIKMLMKLRYPCWTYPFDYSITPEMNIGLSRQHLDQGIPFDSGIPWDNDPADPWADGYIGWSLSGHFEQDSRTRPLDSMMVAARDYQGSATAYEGPYTQLFNATRSDTPLNVNVGVETSISTDYVPGPIQKISLDFNNTNGGVELEGRVFKAGTPLLLCVKYTDSNDMTNKAGHGSILLLDSVSGEEQNITVPNGSGYIYSYMTLTQVGESAFTMVDGTYSGVSETFKIIPEVINSLTSTIADQVADVDFEIEVQAIDLYGNATTEDGHPLLETGEDHIVHIIAEGGFSNDDPTPKNVRMVNGKAVVNIRMKPGTGHLKFVMGSFEGVSNTFTVA